MESSNSCEGAVLPNIAIRWLSPRKREVPVSSFDPRNGHRRRFVTVLLNLFLQKLG